MKWSKFFLTALLHEKGFILVTAQKNPNKQKEDYILKSLRNGYLTFQIISCLMYELEPIMIYLNWVKWH